jgi:hypothetical protein
MREQLVDFAVELSRQTREHVLEVDPRFNLVELGRLQQTHDHRSALASDLAAHEEPIFSIMFL